MNTLNTGFDNSSTKTKEELMEKLKGYQQQLGATHKGHVLVGANINSNSISDWNYDTNFLQSVLSLISLCDKWSRNGSASNFTDFEVKANFLRSKNETPESTYVMRLLVFYWHDRFSKIGFLENNALKDWFAATAEIYRLPHGESGIFLDENLRGQFESLMEGDISKAPPLSSINNAQKQRLMDYYGDKFEIFELVKSIIAILSGKPIDMDKLRGQLTRLGKRTSEKKITFNYGQLDQECVQCFKKNGIDPLQQKKPWFDWLKNTQGWLNEQKKESQRNLEVAQYSELNAHLNENYPWTKLLKSINHFPTLSRVDLSITEFSMTDCTRFITFAQDIKNIVDRLDKLGIALNNPSVDTNFLLRIAAIAPLPGSGLIDVSFLTDEMMHFVISDEFKKHVVILVGHYRREANTEKLLDDPQSIDSRELGELALAQKVLSASKGDRYFLKIDSTYWNTLDNRIQQKIQSKILELLKEDIANTNKTQFETIWFHLPPLLMNHKMKAQIAFVSRCMKYLSGKITIDTCLPCPEGSIQTTYSWLNTKEGFISDLETSIFGRGTEENIMHSIDLYFEATPSEEKTFNLIDRMIRENTSKATYSYIGEHISSDMAYIHNFLGYLLVDKEDQKHNFLSACDQLSKNSIIDELKTRWQDVFFDPLIKAIQNTVSSSELSSMLIFCQRADIKIPENCRSHFMVDKCNSVNTVIRYMNDEFNEWLKGERSTLVMARELHVLLGRLNESELSTVFYLGEKEVRENLQKFRQARDSLYAYIPRCKEWLLGPNLVELAFSSQGLYQLKDFFQNWRSQYDSNRSQLDRLDLPNKIDSWVNTATAKTGAPIESFSTYELGLDQLINDRDIKYYSDVKRSLKSIRVLLEGNYDLYCLIFGKSSIEKAKEGFTCVEDQLLNWGEAIELRKEIYEKSIVGISPYNVEEKTGDKSRRERLDLLTLELQQSLQHLATAQS